MRRIKYLFDFTDYYLNTLSVQYIKHTLLMLINFNLSSSQLIKQWKLRSVKLRVVTGEYLLERGM